MARMRTIGSGGDELDDQDNGIGGQSTGPDAGYRYDVENPSWDPDNSLQYLLDNGMTDPIMSRDRVQPRALASMDDRPTDALGGTARDTVQPRNLMAGAGPEPRGDTPSTVPRDFSPTGPGGYNRQPRPGGGGGQDAEMAPEQSPSPAPAQGSAFEPMPSPLNDPVTLRQLTTPAIASGGGGLFGRSGGLQGGGLDIGRGSTGASDPTQFLEMLLSSLGQ